MATAWPSLSICSVSTSSTCRAPPAPACRSAPSLVTCAMTVTSSPSAKRRIPEPGSLGGRSWVLSAPVRNMTLRPSSAASQGRRRKKKPVNALKATAATSHHKGGLHRYTPATMPPLYPNAAHSKGWRGWPARVSALARGWPVLVSALFAETGRGFSPRTGTPLTLNCAVIPSHG
jgi:hypothetical protein